MPAISRPPARPLSPRRRILREAVLRFARVFGMKLTDLETGKTLGRALVFPFRGKIHIIGLEAEHPVRVAFIDQHRLTYWKQEIGFRAAVEPDFPREIPDSADELS